MAQKTSTGPTRRIALVAHDNCKQDMLEWAAYNRTILAGHELIATATTGRLLAEELGLPVTRLHSGPMVATSRSARASSTASSTCWSSSGTRWRRTRTTPT